MQRGKGAVLVTKMRQLGMQQQPPKAPAAAAPAQPRADVDEHAAAVQAALVAQALEHLVHASPLDAAVEALHALAAAQLVLQGGGWRWGHGMATAVRRWTAPASPPSWLSVPQARRNTCVPSQAGGLTSRLCITE